MSDITTIGGKDAIEALREAFSGDNIYYQTRAGDVSDLSNVRDIFRSQDTTRQVPEQYAKALQMMRNQGGSLVGAFGEFHDGVKDMYLSSARNYEEINRALGGYIDHASLEDSTQTTTKMAIKRYDAMVDAYGNTTEEFIRLQREAGEKIDGDYEKRLKKVGIEFVTEFFTSGQEAAKVQSEVLNLMITQQADAINNMDMLSAQELALIKRNTGLTSETIAKILEKTVIETGEATNDAFFKIAGFSQKMAEETGLSQKVIQDTMAKTITNIEQFGYVTEKEAARISTQLLQLGMRFETFTGLTSKFQEFSSAASMTGDISQLTGGAVQLDAQELAYLASEDQDEFIRELRRSFLDQGFDKEQFLAMTNAEQRALSQSLGMQREELAQLINTEIPISSKAQLDAALGEAEAAGMTTEKKALDLIKQQRNELNKLDEDMAAEFRRKAMDRNRKEATAQIKQLVQLRSEMLQAVNPPDITSDLGGIRVIKAIGGGLLETFKQFNKDGAIMNSMGEGMEYFYNMITGTFGKAGEDSTAMFEEGQGHLKPSSLPPYFHKTLDGLKETFVPGMRKQFKLAGIASAEGFEEGFANMGMDPNSLLAKFETITKVKTEPIMIQKNIERLTQLLGKVQDVDAKKYEDIIEKLINAINILKGYMESVNKNNINMAGILEKERIVNIEMDGRKVAKAVLDNAHQVTADSGAKFEVGIE